MSYDSRVKLKNQVLKDDEKKKRNTLKKRTNTSEIAKQALEEAKQMTEGIDGVDRKQSKRASILPGGLFSQLSAGEETVSIQKRTSLLNVGGNNKAAARRRTTVNLLGGLTASASGPQNGISASMSKSNTEAERLAIREADIADKVSNIFRKVDVKENNEISWIDFTNYVVSSYQSTEVGMVDKIRPYISTNTINTSHNHEIDRIFKIDHGPAGSLVVTERGSYSFKICTPENISDLHSMRVNKWRNISAHNGEVLAVDHLPEFGYLATSSTDCSINFWDLNDFTLKQRLPVSVPQLTMEWHPNGSGLLERENNGILFTAGMMNPKTNKVTIR